MSDDRDGAKPANEALTNDSAPPPAVTSGSGIPVAQQLPSFQQLNMFHGSPGAVDAEALSKIITPESFAQDIANRHAREMRKIDLDEKELHFEEEEAKRAHERDNRDRTELKEADGRLERIFVVLVVFLGLFMGMLVLKDRVDDALKLFASAAALLVAILGGMGLQKLKDDRKRKR